MKHFCTIITSDHLYKASALYDSLIKTNDNISLHVLVIDKAEGNAGNKDLLPYQPGQLAHLGSYKVIAAKYGSNRDKFRWSLKPIFLQYLLQKYCEKVIYLDADLCFFNDCNFLFDLLDTHPVILTPHYYPTDPAKEQNWFEASFRVGLYNAGFVGVNRQSKHLLQWWAACCAYRCEKNALRGTFDDQKYLDLLPVMDEGVHIVRHKGCNIADWNSTEIKRSLQNDELILAGKYPLIFIHFNNTTIRTIVEGREPLLEKYLEQYLEYLKNYRPTLKLADMYTGDSTMNKLKYHIWKLATNAGFVI